MAQRRRYLDGIELVDMLTRYVGHSTGNPACAKIVAETIDALAAVGVDVDGLVKAEVDEMDVVTYPEPKFASRGQSLAERWARITERV